MSILPSIFNKSLNKPRKIGGLYSIDVGQSKDPFNRRYQSNQKNNKGSSTGRSIDRNRNELQSYKRSKIYDESLFQERIQWRQVQQVENFRNSYEFVYIQIKNEQMYLKNIGRQQRQLSQQFERIRCKISKEQQEIEGQVMKGFKMIREKLFESSKQINNQLKQVNKQVEIVSNSLTGIKVLNQYCLKKIQKIENQILKT